MKSLRKFFALIHAFLVNPKLYVNDHIKRKLLGNNLLAECVVIIYYQELFTTSNNHAAITKLYDLQKGHADERLVALERLSSKLGIILAFDKIFLFCPPEIRGKSLKDILT